MLPGRVPTRPQARGGGLTADPSPATTSHRPRACDGNIRIALNTAHVECSGGIGRRSSRTCSVVKGTWREANGTRSRAKACTRTRQWVNESREGIGIGAVTRAHAPQATALQWRGTDDTRYSAWRARMRRPGSMRGSCWSCCAGRSPPRPHRYSPNNADRQVILPILPPRQGAPRAHQPRGHQDHCGDAFHGSGPLGGRAGFFDDVGGVGDLLPPVSTICTTLTRVGRKFGPPRLSQDRRYSRPFSVIL